MERCYSCSQENCRNHDCGCSCHWETQPVKQAAPPAPFVFYAVAENVNYRHTRWYQTYGNKKAAGWVDSIGDAKVWSRRGLAQAKCTSLGGAAQLVEFVVTEIRVIDQNEHRRKLEEKKLKKATEQRAGERLRELADAEEALRLAQEKLERLKKG